MSPVVAFQYRATDCGVTEQIVRNVLLSFYEKVRRDPILGPVFVGAIGTDWDAHIDRIIQFWLTATRLGGKYNGRNFMPAHLQHASIHVHQIPRWLLLFRETAAEQCSPEAASVLVDIAERMAETLEIGLAKRALNLKAK